MDNKDYGDNFDVTGGKSSNDYDLDNFDVDAAGNFSHTVHNEAEETSRSAEQKAREKAEAERKRIFEKKETAIKQVKEAVLLP